MARLDQLQEPLRSHVAGLAGFQQDWNVVFPLDRLRELKEASLVGSIADFHYSFMGAADPNTMEEAAQDLAGLLKKDQVDGLVLVSV
ncbi:MAG: glycine/sarcosine/betaine reductase selenoprotein B family protein [Desulfomonilaceae bacterium]